MSTRCGDAHRNPHTSDSGRKVDPIGRQLYALGGSMARAVAAGPGVAVVVKDFYASPGHQSAQKPSPEEQS